MKEFRLSTAGERAAGCCFTIAMMALFGLLLYALRNDMMLLIFCGVGALLVSVLLLMYVLNVLKASVAVDTENKKLIVKGLRNEEIDVSKAVLLQTFAKKNGQSTLRVMMFSDEEEQIIAAVPTMFTFRQGMWAEPVAKEIAALLEIEFKQNVPQWQFDKELYKQHVQEEAERERKESKERREKRMKARIEKRKQQLK